MLEGLEPRAFWGHFETLTTISRPSRREEPVIEHVRAWAGHHEYELEQDSGRNLVVRVPATRGRESAPDPHSPGSPGHGLRARRGEPERPRRRTDRAAPRRRLADGRRHHAGGRRRRRDRRDDGAGRGRVDPAWPARAPDDGRRGSGARRRECTRWIAAHRLDPDQPRQRGGRRSHRRVRGQYRYLDQDRDAASEAGRGRGHIGGRQSSGGQGGHSGSGIALGRSNAIKVLGRALREAHAIGAVPARFPRRRQEPERDPARRMRDRARSRAGSEDRVPSSDRRRPRRPSATRSPRPIRASRSR